MSEIRFYHMQKTPLERCLPELLGKALSIGHRIIVKLPDEQERERVNDHLWTYDPNSFLPHGSAKDGYGEDQPVWLTAENDNPNKADVLILASGAASDSIGDYKLCCEMLNGYDDDAVKAARGRWKEYKEQGHEVTYWQQNNAGRWEQKA